MRMVIYTPSTSSAGDTTMSTFDDRFGECHDSATLWGMRREIAGPAYDLMAVAGECYYTPATEGHYTDLAHVRASTFGHFVRAARFYRGSLYRAMIRAERYQDLIDGEAIYTPGIDDRCYGECTHHRSAHAGKLDDDLVGCSVSSCACGWDGRHHDTIGAMIRAEGYMI
jgi:hypothetical protein